MCFDELFSVTKLLFEQLQAVECTLTTACQRISELKEQLNRLSQNATSGTFYQIANSLLENDEPPSKTRKTVESEAQLNKLCSDIIDNVHKHLDQRFQSLPELEFVMLLDTNRFEEMSRCFPSKAFSSLFNSRYAEHFNQDELKTELKLLYNDPLLRVGSMHHVIPELSKQNLTPIFSQVIRLFSLGLSLPLTTASTERSFSALKRLKTKLRSTISGDRLCALGLISINYHLAKSVSSDKIIDEFVKMKNRRINLLLK